ncbi:uncharacterized protein PFLUO_LOCUS2897 [Penicillium psychrofluorescens]|uniref:uncharacterized protein n=1 Tax=Penicillium psychrofluorescens TaxID=3158075 RepID=UPI003CCD1304
MAIFDADKRPRGLRMPSLSAMKVGSTAPKSQFTLHSMHSMHSKKFSDLYENDLPAIPPPPTATVYPSPPPPRPPPPPSKELPPTPGDQPLPAAPSPPVLPEKSMSPPAPPSKTPTTGLRSANAPARKAPAAGNAFAIEQSATASPPPARPARSTDRLTLDTSSPLQPPSVILSPSASEQSVQSARAAPLRPGRSTDRLALDSPSQPKPLPQSQSQPQLPTYASPKSSPLPKPQPQAQPQPKPLPQPQPQAQPQPKPLPQPQSQAQPQPKPLPQPQSQAQPQPKPLPQPQPPTQSQPAKSTSSGLLCSGSITALEDFDLSPAAVGMGDPFDRTSSDELGPVLDTPPAEAEIPPASLKPVHFLCFQEHRNMPVSKNVWHPVPCMLCQKRDTEIRHRCVFCDLRVCEGCFKTLQKCPRRSLQEMMGSLR